MINYLKKYKFVDDKVKYLKNCDIEHAIVKTETPRKPIKLKARKFASL